MDADRPLKELLRLRPRDLLALIGDAGAAFVSTQVAELPSLSRRVDTVLRLRRGRQEYLRHLEFEVRYRKGLELRCFEYATRLAVRFRVPVLTTVVLLEKPGRRELAYREVLDGRVVHERRFDVLRLWEVDPERALGLGPGAAALVGLAEKATLPLLARAARKIHRETEGVVRSDLLFILQALSRRRYTDNELAGVVPRETIMASSLWAEARSQGRKEGRQEGRQEGAVEASRAFCVELTREHHPELGRPSRASDRGVLRHRPSPRVGSSGDATPRHRVPASRDGAGRVDVQARGPKPHSPPFPEGEGKRLEVAPD